MERDPLVRALLLLLAAIGLIWLGGWAWEIVSRFADILLLFFLAWLLAFVLGPVARRLRMLGLPQAIAVGAVYAGLAVLLILVGLLVIPNVVMQLVQLAGSLPALANDLQIRADQLHVSLVERGLPEAQLSDVYRNAINRAEIAGTVLLSNTLVLATAIVNSVLRGLLVLIISFYIMLEGDRLATVTVSLVPQRYRDDVATAFEQVDRTFGGFVRGQLIQAAVYGGGTALIMELAALPYTLVLSIFSGIVMLIPIVGPFLAMAPPIILTLILAPGRLWWVFILLYALQFVVLNVLAPRIMSRSVGIHPLMVFAAVLVGTRLAGGWGAIFGVPVAAMLWLLMRAFYLRVVLHTPLYRKGVRLSAEALVPYAPRTPPAGAGTGPATRPTPATEPAPPVSQSDLHPRVESMSASAAPSAARSAASQ